MVLVPEDLNDTKSIERAKKLLSPIHFGKFTICDYDRHDAMIAFTSQMAHVVSNAYVKSPTAKNHDGFSAGSYKDLTRVAWLNETMWTELFLENKKHLIKELDYFITALQEYKTAMENDDAETLKKLLKAYAFGSFLFFWRVLFCLNIRHVINVFEHAAHRFQYRLTF